MRQACGLAAVGLAVSVLCGLAKGDAYRSAVEADWLTQHRVRANASPVSGNVTTAEDAAGAVDGIKDGKWGFHTDKNANPAWWQVDLGKPQPIGRVILYNRCDFPTRTAALEMLLSDDGKTWRSVYRHDGSPFYGFSDSKPLSISLTGQAARFLRLQLPPQIYFHLDEVEVYAPDDGKQNLALRRPADQSTTSQWSSKKRPAAPTEPPFHLEETLVRGRQLIVDLRQHGANVTPCEQTLAALERDLKTPRPESRDPKPDSYFSARSAIRSLALANPLLDFDQILFVKRAPGIYSHMSDQFYSWWSRPGGGVFILEGFKSGSPRIRCLTNSFAPGSFLSPDLSYDAKKVVFSYCRFYEGRSALKDKVNKEAQPEDSFYHIFEMNLDGTGLRQITRGRYDDIFPRYLPNGEIVFLSTRRGQFIQCGKQSAQATLDQTEPDSYVRCGGGAYRPVALYTLHTMDRDGRNMNAISAFESFEWDPAVASDGRIFYARWDYVDRHNGPYMKLWSTNPDGTNPRIVWGNYTRNPQSTFEARSIPNSRKLLMTASAHHSITGGSLVLLDPASGMMEGAESLTRLTPEVCFPETEGWPQTYYGNPFPLSEKYYLCTWSDQPIKREGSTNPANATGLYLYDAFGNLELLYRDPAISSMYPLPVRPRPTPPAIASTVDWDGPQEGRFLLQNVYASLDGIAPGSVKRLRIIAMPVKVQPTMNSPYLGVTAEDPGKCILGTVPVEADGSAYFRVPSGVSVFFQALDQEGKAVQTMRSLTYVQPGQTLSCVGCHESRTTAPASARPLAAAREPSRLKPGPDGAWPLRYDRLVQPVLDRHCVSCHSSDGKDPVAAKTDLTPAKSYTTLVTYGKPSLSDRVKQAWMDGRSIAGSGPAHTSVLLAYLQTSPTHAKVLLDPDSLDRLITWMDTYAQKQGSFSDRQEEQLLTFRRQVQDLLVP